MVNHTSLFSVMLSFHKKDKLIQKNMDTEPTLAPLLIKSCKINFLRNNKNNNVTILVC